MADYIKYLLEANIILILLFAVYQLMKNQLNYNWRRAALLAIPVMTFAVFVFRGLNPFQPNAMYKFQVYQLNTIDVGTETNSNSASFFSRESAYWLGVFVFFTILSVRLVSLIGSYFKSEKTKKGNFTIIHVPNKNCASFFNVIQINPLLGIDEQEVIIEHEKIHAQKKHSFDVLYLELVHCLSWFNPIIIFYKRELTDVHEYQVDAVMYRQHKSAYMEFLLSYSFGTNLNPYLLTNQFYTKSTLIKRLKSMKNNSKKRWALALVLPAMAACFTLVSWTYVEVHQPNMINSIATEKLADEIEKMPEFKGGQEALASYLGQQIVYPQKAKENNIEGTVFIGFVVTKTGAISDAKVVRGADELLDAEALRVIASMPNWTPGESGGKAVNVEMTLPIKFKL